MVAGPRAREIDPGLWRRAVLTWMSIILAETAHGVLRELFLAPQIGDLRARQIGVPIGCVIIFVIAWLTARWLNARSRGALLAVGALWVALTLTFEFAVGRATGASWSRILSDYNPARGGFMLLGLAFMLAAPLLAARLRNTVARNTA
jgi:hypothetical protein